MLHKHKYYRLYTFNFTFINKNKIRLNIISYVISYVIVIVWDIITIEKSIVTIERNKSWKVKVLIKSFY